jgi:hypothetical protein
VAELDEKLLEFLPFLVEVTDHIDGLSDVLVDGEAVMALLISNLDVDWVDSAEATGQSLDLLWPGG